MGRLSGNTFQKLFGENWNAKCVLKKIKGGESVDNNYCVYIHKFPNNYVYVGLTKQKPIDRWGKNGSGYKEQPIYNDIVKFGWNNIKHIIYRDGLSKDEARQLEIDLIDKYRKENRSYNIKDGGEAGGEPWVFFDYNGENIRVDKLLKYSKVDDLTSHDLTNRINSHNWTVDKALSQPKIKKVMKYEYNGKKYSAQELVDISNVDGLTNTDITNRINQLGWSIERAITQPKNVKKQPRGIGKLLFEYNGNYYNSFELEQMSSVQGITGKIIAHRISTNGWSVEDAITKPLKKRNQIFEYNGEMYSSKELAEMSNVDGLTHHDITDRINGQGWTVERAITQPKRKHN